MSCQSVDAMFVLPNLFSHGFTRIHTDKIKTESVLIRVNLWLTSFVSQRYAGFHISRSSRRNVTTDERYERQQNRHARERQRVSGANRESELQFNQRARQQPRERNRQ